MQALGRLANPRSFRDDPRSRNVGIQNTRDDAVATIFVSVGNEARIGLPETNREYTRRILTIYPSRLPEWQE